MAFNIMSDMKSIRFPHPVADAMARTILESSKTATWRVVKPPALDKMIVDDNGECIGSLNCQPGWEVDIYPTIDDSPYQPGDILYVRETWNQNPFRCDRFIYRADGCYGPNIPWCPSVHMPKEAARLFLRVTDVRVERLKDMNYIDACAEGFAKECGIVQWQYVRLFWNRTIKKADLPHCGWEANPWVWVIEFERISREDAIKSEGE